jgi:hypothetical protein
MLESILIVQLALASIGRSRSQSVPVEQVGEKEVGDIQEFRRCGNFVRALIPNHILLGGGRSSFVKTSYVASLVTTDDNEQSTGSDCTIITIHHYH